MKQKKIITLCSSASFYPQVLEIEKQLKQLGFAVKIPKTARKIQKTKDFDVVKHRVWLQSGDFSEKTALMNEHFKKVLAADAILVVNFSKNGIDGYIGGNGLLEMFLAYFHKKPIYVLNLVNKKSSLYEEIMGLKPKIIDSDLTKIKL